MLLTLRVLQTRLAVDNLRAILHKYNPDIAPTPHRLEPSRLLEPPEARQSTSNQHQGNYGVLTTI